MNNCAGHTASTSVVDYSIYTRINYKTLISNITIDAY